VFLFPDCRSTDCGCQIQPAASSQLVGVPPPGQEHVDVDAVTVVPPRVQDAPAAQHQIASFRFVVRRVRATQPGVSATYGLPIHGASSSHRLDPGFPRPVVEVRAQPARLPSQPVHQHRQLSPGECALEVRHEDFVDVGFVDERAADGQL